MVIITRSINTQEPDNQVIDHANPSLTELDFATAEFAKINAGEGTSRQGGNGGIQRPHGATVLCYRSGKDDQKLRLVSMHLFDKALNWHLQFVKKFGENMPWNVYETEILSRFGEVYDDPLVELKNLKQTSDVQSYQDKFEMLLNKVDLSESQAVSMFMRGLKSKVRVTLRMFKPVTIKDVSRPSPATPVRKKLTQKELEEKRPKNQCFYCDQRYVPGHKCSGQLYALEVMVNDIKGEEIVEEIHADVVEEEEFVDCYMGKQLVHILMGSGSTHNFLAMAAARKIGCQLRRTVPLEVSVANGNQMASEYMCKDFEWTIQGITYKADVMVIPLSSCDMVLGVQWLATLGDIVWNFKKLTKEYKYKGKRVVLSGSQHAVLTCLKGKKFPKKAFKDKAELSLMSLCMYLGQLWQLEGNDGGSMNTAIQGVLDDYKSVFEVPKELPPQRVHDHAIPLMPNTPPINIRPYKHPPSQKEVVELMVKVLALILYKSNKNVIGLISRNWSCIVIG
ncbi:LysM domain-containing GPI-anchored protein 2 [Tanacetum coccineum]